MSPCGLTHSQAITNSDKLTLPRWPPEWNLLGHCHFLLSQQDMGNTVILETVSAVCA